MYHCLIVLCSWYWKKVVLHYVKLTNPLSFKLDFQKLDQHTRGQWLIHHDITWLCSIAIILQSNEFYHNFKIYVNVILKVMRFKYQLQFFLSLWMLSGPFELYWNTAIQFNHTPNKVWHEITYPFPNFFGFIVDVWEWVSNISSHFIMGIITNPCTD